MPKIDIDAIYDEGADLAESVLEQEPTNGGLAVAIGLLLAEASKLIVDNACCPVGANTDFQQFTAIMQMAGDARAESYKTLARNV